MALDLNRWWQYAKARLDRAVRDGNRSLARLEAEREAELADKPWLRADREAPTLDEARARIEWETERQRDQAQGGPRRDDPVPDPAAAPTAARPEGTPSRSVEDVAADAEQEAARLELDRRERESAARLDQIRKELGVEAPPVEDPNAEGAPPTNAP